MDVSLPPEVQVEQPVSDILLLGRFARGNDLDAAEELIDRHQADLLRVAHALLGNAQAAQDAVQEGFLALCRERHRLAAADQRQIGGWLCRVVRNHCLDQLRARAYRRHQDAGSLELPGREAAPDKPVEAADGAAQVWAEVAVLPPLERAAILLRYRDGLSYQDIAQRLDKSATHVGVLLHAALGRLRTSPRLAGATP